MVSLTPSSLRAERSNPENMPKLLYLVATDNYFCSHRLDLAKAAIQAGFEVAVATRCHHHQKDIEDAGIEVFPLRYFTRSGINPWRQFLSLKELYKIYQTYRPDIVHHVAMKPVVLGSIVAWICKVPKVINALGGLGYLFTDSEIPPFPPFSKGGVHKKILHFLTCHLLKILLNRPNTTVILQNQDDIALLIKAASLRREKVVLIPGSGIDLNAFPVKPMPPEPPVIIACVARMLWDKGIGELVDAAKILQTQKASAKIILYGEPDPENPASIPSAQLQIWHNAGLIHWKGHCKDIAKAYAECHIAVLPSYREGLPKSLLEAASCGRAIVTTDVPGCRDVVKEGSNGLLVPAKDSSALAQALMTLIENQDLRNAMGKQGQLRIQTQFSNDIIHQKIIALYQTLAK